MGKKQRPINAEPNPAIVPFRDVHQRLNYLYQLSTFFSGLAPGLGLSDTATTSIRSGATSVEAGKGKEREGWLIPTQVDSTLRTPALSATTTHATRTHRSVIKRTLPNAVEHADEKGSSKSRNGTGVDERKDKGKAKAVGGSHVGRECARLMRQVAQKGTIKM